MEELVVFFVNYGPWITLIAIIGIAGLGAMKYCNCFSAIEESKRHYIYLLISVGFSAVAAAIYLSIINAFEWNYFLAVAGAIYALNQTFYAIFKITPVNDVVVKILDWVVKFLKQHGALQFEGTIKMDEEENHENN